MTVDSVFTPQTNQRERRVPKALWIALLAALLVHLLFFILPWDQILRYFYPTPLSAPRVELKTVTPEEISKMKESWKSKEKQLLLSQKKAAEKDAPKDARYSSDKNARVEKETRAKQTDVIPKAGGEAIPEVKKQNSRKQALDQAKPHAFPKLSDLGVNMHFSHAPERMTPLERPNQDFQRARPAQEAGADQALNDERLPYGAENLLNTAESIYYSFYSRLYQAVGPLWQSTIRSLNRRVPEGEYVTQVDVVFDKDGNLVAINYISRSGIQEFDQAVEESWKKIKKFPNPPLGLLDLFGKVHTGWTFNIHVSRDFGLSSAPPARVY